MVDKEKVVDVLWGLGLHLQVFGRSNFGNLTSVKFFNASYYD